MAQQRLIAGYLPSKSRQNITFPISKIGKSLIEFVALSTSR
jgi:hypothetical protein